MSSCCGGNKSIHFESSCCTSSSKPAITTGAVSSGAGDSCCKSSASPQSNTGDSGCCKSTSTPTPTSLSSTGGCCQSNGANKGDSGCCKSGSTEQPQQESKQIVASYATEIKNENVVTTFQGCPSETPQAGKESMCQGCPGQNACQSQNETNLADKKSIDIRMKPIRHKILVMSGKGGVGKSTVASLIAYALASRNQKVSVLDVDLCGPSIPLLLNVQDQQIVNSEYGWVPLKTPNHEIKVMSVGSLLNSPDSPVIWKGPRKTNMIKRLLKDTFWGKQDYLVIDTPPGTSDEHLSVISSLQSCNPDGAVLVTTPQDLSIDIVKKEIALCRKLNLPIIGIIENLSGYACPCCDEVTEIFQSNSKGGAENLCKEYNIPFLGKIPIDTNLSMCADSGRCSICEYSSSAGSISILKILDKLVEQK